MIMVKMETGNMLLAWRGSDWNTWPDCLRGRRLSNPLLFETDSLLVISRSCSAFSWRVAALISVWLFAAARYIGFKRRELTAWAEHICLSSYVCFSFRVVSITHSQRGGADAADCEPSFSRCLLPELQLLLPRSLLLRRHSSLRGASSGLVGPDDRLLRPLPGPGRGGKKKSDGVYNAIRG